MKNNKKFNETKENLIKENEAKYGEETKKLYGEDVVKKSNEIFMNMTKEDIDKLNELSIHITSSLENAVKNKLDASSKEVKEIANLHKEWIKMCVGTYNEQMHLEITNMYVNDTRFKKYYDSNIDGCAKLLRDAVKIMINKE